MKLHELFTLIAQQPAEASLWTIVVALAGVIAWGGRHVMAKLKDCEQDREDLHRKISKVAVAFAAETGHTIDLDEDE